MTTAVEWLAAGVVGYSLIFHVSRCLYAVDRGRLAVAATAAGWLTVSVGAAVLVRLWAPQGGDGPATLRALGAGTTLGMTVAGVALLLALRRALGAGSLTGVARTVLVGVTGAVLGALAGRVVTDLLLGALSPVLLSGILAALAGAAVAGGVALLAVHLGDRSSLRVAGWST